MAKKRAEIVNAQVDHILPIAQNVREGDREEFAAIFRTAQSVMIEGFQVSDEAWTGLIDGEPVCMFGVAPAGFLFPDCGRPWMVGCSKLDENALLFLRRCRTQVEVMLSIYPVLVNYVAASNVRAIEWLRWLKFEVSDEPTMMGRGVPFLRFERRAHNENH